MAIDNYVSVSGSVTPPIVLTGGSIKMVGVPFCPDLLCYEQLGVADNWRGRVIRGFFWLMRAWKVGT